MRGPYERAGRSPIHSWTVHGTNAERVAEILEPFLSLPKRQQIQAAKEEIAV